MKEISEKIFSFFHEKELQSLYLLAPIFMGGGVILFFNLSFEPKLIYSTIIFSVFLASTIILYRIKKSFLPVLFITLFIAGFFFADLRTVMVNDVVIGELDEPVWVRADLEKIQKNEKDTTIIVKNNDLWRPETKSFPPEKTPYRMRITVRTQIAPDIRVGDRIAFKAMLQAPAKKAAFPGGYDFAKVAYFQRIGAVGYAINDVKLFEKKQPNFIDRFQDYFYRKVNDDILDKDIAGIIVSQITADRVEISNDAKQAMRNAGLGHLIAISGLNMSVAMVWLFFLSRTILAFFPRIALQYDTKKISCFIAIFFGFLYLLVTGMPISAVRAFLMVLLFFIGILADRFSISLHPVAFAAMIILIFAPEQLVMPSFQLSFAAVIGLIGMYEIYERYLKKERTADRSFITKWLFIFFSIIATTFFTSLTTAPFGIMHFGTFQNYGIISNMIGVPVVSILVLPFAFLSIPAMPLGIEKPFLMVAEFGSKIILNTGYFISSKPNSVTYTADLPSHFIIFIVAGFLILFIFKTRIRWIGIPIILFGYFLIFQKPETPDFVINETGSLIAMKQDDGGYRYFGINRQSFALYQFNSKLGVAKPEFIKSSDECNRKKCTYEKDGKKIAFGTFWNESECGQYDYMINLGKFDLVCDPEKLSSRAQSRDLTYKLDPSIPLRSTQDDTSGLPRREAPRNDVPVIINKVILEEKGAHLFYLKQNKLITAVDGINNRAWNNH